MTNTDFHARRTELSNTFAAAGAELLDYMRCAGALAAIPNTQQYVVAGDIAAIRAQLDTVAPQRRMRHGDRPELPLYFGADAGQPRRWAALITSAGHGVLQEYGTAFEHAQPGQEVLEVMEILPGVPTIANKATEEGELPALPQEIEVGGEGWDFEDFKSQKTFSVDHMHEYARRAIAADRASRQVANKEEVEPVGASTVLTDEQLRETDGYKLGWMEGMSEGAELATGGEKTAEDVEAEFADLLPGSYYMDPPDGGSPSVLEQVSRMAEDAAKWREVAAQAGQVAVPGWVSVDDRLPEVEQLVMVYAPASKHEGENISFDCIDPNDDDHSSWLGHNEHYEHFCCVAKPEGSIGPSEKAPYTHWMPLPLPPSPAKESK